MENDKCILRKLAFRVREISELPEMNDRKKAFSDLNSLKADKPIILCSPEGSWCELVPESSLKCEDPIFRAWEKQLRQKVFSWENICDDQALDAYLDLQYIGDAGNFGVEFKRHFGSGRGSYTWEVPIKDLPNDLENLSFRKPTIDMEESLRRFEIAEELLGDIIKPRLHCTFWWTMGLSADAIRLVGLENFMLLMYDNPDGLHKLMAWLSAELLNFIGWYEKEGYLSLNNGLDFIASGGVGLTDQLPQRILQEGDKVLLKDIWGFSESQETVGVSPSMFGEFVFPYQLPLLEKYGLNSYGCCEALHDRWEYISKIPRLRRVSISPWCNQEIMSEKLGRNYIFSRKPNPSLVCACFDEDAIRKDIRHTLEVSKNNIVEIILKDTHTVQHEPWRLKKWVEIVREEIENC